MYTHHKLAVLGAAGVSAIALSDAVTHGLTGHYSMFADDSGNDLAIVVGDLIHAALYACLVIVLAREADRFDASNKVARLSRRVLVVAFGALSVCMAVPVSLMDQKSTPSDILGIIATIFFLAMILFSMTLGLAVLRSNPLGIGGRLLGAILPVLLFTIGVAFAAPDWAHPGYLEATINFGLALVGVRAVGVSRSTVPAPPRSQLGRA